MITLKKLLIYSIAGILFTLVACDSTNSNNDTPPEIPSNQSMSVDFSEMENAQNDKKKSVVAESNFNAAFITAGVIKVILDVNLAIPKILVTSAQQYDSEQIADGKWEWSYTTNANETNLGVRLTAETNSNSDVAWMFFVTNSSFNPPLSNKLFFEGTSDYNATTGTWSYYDLNTSEEVSFITWSRGESFTSVDLEVKSGRNDNLGDTIEYDFDGTTKTVVYFDASSDESTTVSFNTETNVGFIISSNHNNGEKSCWDVTLANIPCSE